MSSAPSCFRLSSSKRSTYQSLHGAVKGVSVVAAELGVNTLEGRVTVSLRLLDTVGIKWQISATCLLPQNVVGGYVARWSRVIQGRFRDVKSITATILPFRPKYFDFRMLRTVRTRYGEPSGCGGAETRSWTLFKVKMTVSDFRTLRGYCADIKSIREFQNARFQVTYWPS
jgi:hypothetical protein